MAVVSTIKSALPPTCEVSTPAAGDSIYTFLSKRWMTLGPSTLPAAAVVPSTEEDVVAVVRHAAANGLRVLPQCGACGGVVITNWRTVCLDMRKFRSVDVDVEAETVTFGGGALTRDVQPAVTAEGYYTGWPNLGAVGMVGTVLGGGINLFMGTRGLTCDNLLSARMVTSTGEIAEVSAGSTGAERRCFNLLKGAGAGLGVVLSMTMRIYPASELCLVEGTKIPEVTAMFTRDNFDAAAELWEWVSRTAGVESVGFMIMTAPPTMPIAGQPVVVVHMSYPGPASGAEKAFEPFHAPEVGGKALMVMPGLAELRTMNAQRDVMMTKGESMDCFNGLVGELSGESLLRVATRFAEFVDARGTGIGRTMTAVHRMPAQALERADGAGESFMCHRDRNFMVQSMVWDVDAGHAAAGEKYARDVLDIVRSEDKTNGVPNAVLAGNARVEADMTEILSPEKLELLKGHKREWDPNNVFWNPAVDGWAYEIDSSGT